MLRRLTARLTYANVIATLALFIALGGSAYAAFKLPKNSVGTKQLKNGAVTAAKVRSGTLTGKQVARNTLTGRNINAATLGIVPNAKHATTAGSASTAGSATTAGNALKLGGASASSYFRLPGSGINSDVSVAAGETKTVSTMSGYGLVTGVCNSPCSNPAVSYTNTTSRTELMEYDTAGNGDYGYTAVAPGATVGPYDAPAVSDNLGYVYFWGVQAGTANQFYFDGLDDIEPGGGTGTTFYFDSEWES